MTWLHIPPQYISAQVTEDSNLPCDRGEYEPWLTLSGTATQRPSSWKGWNNRGWIRHLFGMTSQPLTANLGAAAWISSLPVFPVNHSQPPQPQSALAVDLTMTVGSGLPSQPLSLKFDPDSLCWKTCHQLFVKDYPLSSQTLPGSGSMRNGACSQRPTLVPLTDASVGGAWPTPMAHDAKGGQNKPGTRAADDLLTAAKMFRFPHCVTTLPGGTNGLPKVDLNPWFVATLMGLPPDWLTLCTSAVTGLCRKQLQKQSDNCLLGADGS